MVALAINPQYGLLMPTLISAPIEPKQKLFTKIRKTYEKSNKRKKNTKHQTTNQHGHAHKCKKLTLTPIEIGRKKTIANNNKNNKKKTIKEK